MLQKTVDDPYIIWDKTEIAEIDVDTTTPGISRVKVVYAYDKAPVIGATTIVNGILCAEVEPGVYRCGLSTWNPYQTVSIYTDCTGFARATKTISTAHVMNLILYLTTFTIGASMLVLLVAYVYKKRVKNPQRHNVFPPSRFFRF